jgi:proteasome lid subunit RPN8/RPN11
MKIENMFYIKEKDWYKLQAWAQLSYDEDKNEISGLMTAIPQKDGRYLMSDIEILRQENTTVETDIDADSIMEYQMKYGMKYNNPNMKFVWWHSHHNMGVSWSSTDLKEINEWKNNSFSLALVINLREEYTFRVSLWNCNGIPIEEHFDTSLTIERKESVIKITDTMKKQYKELCETQKSQGVIHSGGYISYNNHRQMNLLAGRGKSFQNIDISAYSQAHTKVESMQEAFCDGTLPLKDYLKEVKKFNKTCKEEKMPFKFKDFGKDYQKLLNIMMTLTPGELFEWDNNIVKDEYEHAHEWGGYNNGWY